MDFARERLEAIDRELAALGKSDEELLGVVERARALVAAIGDVDATLDALGEGHEEAIAAAAAAAAQRARRSAQAPRPEPAAVAESAAVAEPPPSSAQVLEAVHPASAPPPDFEDDSTDVRHVAEIEAAQASVTAEADERPRRSSDIAGLSVDELFSDADPSAPQDSMESGLADLFDDEPFGLSEPDSGFASLEDELEGDSAAGPAPALEADTAADRETADREDESAADFEAAFPRFGEEEEEESTHVLGADDLAHMVDMVHGESSPSDEFELLVDEDVLELDSEDVRIEEDEEADAEAQQGSGLLGRILGRD